MTICIPWNLLACHSHHLSQSAEHLRRLEARPTPPSNPSVPPMSLPPPICWPPACWHEPEAPRPVYPPPPGALTLTLTRAYLIWLHPIYDASTLRSHWPIQVNVVVVLVVGGGGPPMSSQRSPFGSTYRLPQTSQSLGSPRPRRGVGPGSNRSRSWRRHWRIGVLGFGIGKTTPPLTKEERKEESKEEK